MDKPEKKVEKVVNGQVKIRKKNELRKFTDIFINEDISNVKTYIVTDVLIPSLKKAFSEIIKTGTDMLLYGTIASKNNSNMRRVSYNSYYDSSHSTRAYSPRNYSYSFDDIIFNSYGEAEEVLIEMNNLVKKYKIVSVADLYDLAGIPCRYTDNRYGWMELRDADVVRVRDGYMLRLPKALPLD